MIVSTPTRTFTKTLGENEGKLARALLGGHSRSIAKAVMQMSSVREEVFTSFLNVLDNECRRLCQKQADTPSKFKSSPVDQLHKFSWKELIHELTLKAPKLLKILTTIVARNDHRNKHKIGSAHYPGICMAAAVLLKERNREMCGVQSLVSLLMYSCHCEKQV